MDSHEKHDEAIIESGAAENRLLLQVAFTDPSDMDWMRTRLEGAVESALTENRERFDGRYETEIRIDQGEVVRPLATA